MFLFNVTICLFNVIIISLVGAFVLNQKASQIEWLRFQLS